MYCTRRVPDPSEILTISMPSYALSVRRIQPLTANEADGKCASANAPDRSPSSLALQAFPDLPSETNLFTLGVNERLTPVLSVLFPLVSFNVQYAWGG